MLRTLAILVLLLGHVVQANAQIQDDFSDQDLTAEPRWSGDLDRWKTGLLELNPALQTSGHAETDTIYLALETHAAFGQWEFTFAHQGINLSTFNGARVFVTVDADKPDGAPHGYFLQLGTNNSDAVSLWRVDGSLDKRTELGRSITPILAGDSSLLRVTVERSTLGEWVVAVDGTSVLEAVDARYMSGSHLLLWVKHTSQGAESFFFDDLIIRPIEAPPPPVLPPSILPQPGDLVINEVQFDPLPGASEFFELYNRSDSTFDLRDVSFRDSRSPPLELADSTYLLEPAEFAVFAADGEAFGSQFRRTRFVEPSRWASLNNGGDVLVIESGGVVIDSVTYVDDTTPSGFSLERIDPNGPSDAFNFGPSIDPFGATPGERNSIYEPDELGPSLLFAEQMTERSFRLHFDEPINAESLTADAVRFDSHRPDSITVHDAFSIVAYFSTLPRSSSVEVIGAADWRGNISEILSASVSFFPTKSDIIVNEILYEPVTNSYDGRPNQSEFIELFNRSARRLSLRGLFTTRAADESGDADTLDVSQLLTGLDPGGYYIIAGDSGLAAHLLEAPILVAASLSLPNSGDIIRLHHSSGILIDSARYHTSLHHPDLLESRGVSLERIDAEGPSIDPSNWTTSVDPSGATPGRPNSVRFVQSPPPTAFGVMVSPNPFSPDRDGIDDIAGLSYKLRAEVSILRVRIFNRRGVLVRELVPTRLVGSEGTVYWDGLDELGRRLRVGIYIMLLEAFDSGHNVSETYKAVVVLARDL